MSTPIPDFRVGTTFSMNAGTVRVQALELQHHARDEMTGIITLAFTGNIFTTAAPTANTAPTPFTPQQLLAPLSRKITFPTTPS